MRLAIELETILGSEKVRLGVELASVSILQQTRVAIRGYRRVQACLRVTQALNLLLNCSSLMATSPNGVCVRVMLVALLVGQTRHVLAEGDG